MTSHRYSRPKGALLLILLVVGLILASPARQSAHDIPGDVTVQAFVKPEGQRLRLLVRVPLEALSDMVFPTYGPGYLDFERARERDEFIDAAMIWMGQEVQMFENDRRLEEPTIAAIKVALPSDRSFETYETFRAPYFRQRRKSCGNKPCLTCSLTTPSNQSNPNSRSALASNGWGSVWSPFYGSYPQTVPSGHSISGETRDWFGSTPGGTKRRSDS